MFPKELHEFVLMALHNAERFAIWISDFSPIPEGIVIGIVPQTNQLLGARVYFQPPVKAVWVTPDGNCTSGDYEQKRKDQLPLTATYYKIELDDVGKYEGVTVFANPAQ